MNKKTQTMVILGLVAVGGYMWWKSRKDSTTEGTSSAIGGGGYIQGSCVCTSCAPDQDKCYTKTGREGGSNPCGTGYVWRAGACPAPRGVQGQRTRGGRYSKPRYTSRS